MQKEYNRSLCAGVTHSMRKSTLMLTMLAFNHSGGEQKECFPDWSVMKSTVFL